MKKEAIPVVVPTNRAAGKEFATGARKGALIGSIPGGVAGGVGGAITALQLLRKGAIKDKRLLPLMGAGGLAGGALTGGILGSLIGGETNLVKAKMKQHRQQNLEKESAMKKTAEQIADDVLAKAAQDFNRSQMAGMDPAKRQAMIAQKKKQMTPAPTQAPAVGPAPVKAPGLGIR